MVVGRSEMPRPPLAPDQRPRRRWPATRLTIRGDGHYGRPEVMDWCEANGGDYLFGRPGNTGAGPSGRRGRSSLRLLLEGDIERYFDRVPHEPLMRKAEEVPAGWTGAELVADLLGLWLEAGALSLDSPGVGIPQGSPLSPLLSNLYLDAVDEHFIKLHAKLRLIRFADDCVVLAREEAKAAQALEQMRSVLAEHGLGLNPERHGSSGPIRASASSGTCSCARSSCRRRSRWKRKPPTPAHSCCAGSPKGMRNRRPLP